MTTITRTMSEKIMQWNELQEKLAFIKQEEARMRKEIVTKLFAEASVGTNTIDLGKGYKLKAVIKNNTSIDQGALDNMEIDIDWFIQQGSISFAPKLSATAYKKLDEKAQKVLDTALVVKPGAPTLSLIAPKEEK